MKALPKTHHFFIFQEVVRCGSIRGAARSLGLTQPSVTKTIHDIEDYFGLELIIRNNTGIELTDAGKLLLPHSRTVLKDLTHAVNDMRRLLNDPVTEVAFGFSSLISFTAMPDIVQKFCKSNPGARITMQEAQLSTLLPALREGRLDFAIGTVTQDMPVQNLMVYPLFDAEFAYISCKGHPLATCETLNALQHARWVLPRTDMGYYQALSELLENNVVDTDRVVRTDSVITIFNLVAHAGFITVLARAMSAPFDGCQFTEVPVREMLPKAHYALVFSRNRRLSPASEALISVIRAYNWSIFPGMNKL
ncbi:transcriptional regulator TdcA [Salmonella enterica subsp. enterica serovar Colindale]|nr:transcriptional regulator TdcA [Salmonella enterica subsp. enterica serovar Colindale]